jgi:hypothetical protein
MIHKIRIGDRFKYMKADEIWEIVSLKSDSTYDMKLISGDYPRRFDFEHINFLINEYYYKYLGNFSKSSNFRDIYDILNDGAGS